MLIETYVNRRIDSEFFEGAYIKAETKILQCQTEKLGKLGSFIPGPFGSAFHVQNYDFKSSYRYIRGRDVKPFFLLDDDNRYIPESDFNRLTKYLVLPQDLMISVVGTLGNVSICTEDDTPAVFSCKSTILRTWKIDPYYLLAYLNCHYGRMCLLRRQRGAVQTGLNIEDLRAVPVPRFKEEIENQISSFVQSSHFAAKQAKDSYAQAQQLLKYELGLDSLRFDKPVGYTAQFSELELSRRFDSEHYYPAFDNLKDKLPEHIQLVPLSSVLTFCQRGKQPIYSAHGLPVLNSKHILENKISLEGNRYAKPTSVTNLQIQYGDVLINGTGRGTIGRTAPYLVSEHQAIPDNHVTILRSSTLDPAYLSFYLNSLAGKLQVEKYQRGSSGQLELYPFDIRKFQVWDAPQSIQQEIRQLYDQATESARQSKQLLDQAKSRVEQLIEDAILKT
jgi:hypothetical protein